MTLLLCGDGTQWGVLDRRSLCQVRHLCLCELLCVWNRTGLMAAQASGLERAQVLPTLGSGHPRLFSHGWATPSRLGVRCCVSGRPVPGLFRVVAGGALELHWAGDCPPIPENPATSSPEFPVGETSRGWACGPWISSVTVIPIVQGTLVPDVLQGEAGGSQRFGLFTPVFLRQRPSPAELPCGED